MPLGTLNRMSLTHQSQEAAAANSPGNVSCAASLERFKTRLNQLEMQLSRLAVVYGLGYGSLQKLAPCFLRVKAILLKLIREQEHDGDLVDLAEYLLTTATERELCVLEEHLLAVRRYAQDSGREELAPAYHTLMKELVSLEQELQAALQRALGNIAG